MLIFRELEPGAAKIFQEGLRGVASEFRITAVDEQRSLKVLSRFEILNGYQSLFVHAGAEFIRNQKKFSIVLIEKQMTIMKRTGRSRRHSHPVNVHEIEPVILIDVPPALGHVFIRHETLGDKIADIFNRIDIDFEQYPKFSANYFMVAENPDAVRKHMPSNLLAALETTKELTLEIKDGVCLGRHEKTLSPESLHDFISLGRELVR